MPSNYLIPLNEIRREHEAMKSRFIATLTPAFSIDEARAFMAKIKKEFVHYKLTNLTGQFPQLPNPCSLILPNQKASSNEKA